MKKWHFEKILGLYVKLKNNESKFSATMTVKWEEKALIVTNMKCDRHGRSPNKTHEARRKLLLVKIVRIGKIRKSCWNLANGCHQLSSSWVFLSRRAIGTNSYNYPLFAKQMWFGNKTLLLPFWFHPIVVNGDILLHNRGLLESQKWKISKLTTFVKQIRCTV